MHDGDDDDDDDAQIYRHPETWCGSCTHKHLNDRYTYEVPSKSLLLLLLLFLVPYPRGSSEVCRKPSKNFFFFRSGGYKTDYIPSNAKLCELLCMVRGIISVSLCLVVMAMVSGGGLKRKQKRKRRKVKAQRYI